LDRFLAAIRSSTLHAAQRELVNSPELASINIHAASSIGDADAVRYHLDLDPKLVGVEHDGWPPLIYACASRLHQRNPRHAAGILDCVSLLLDRGADPNTYTLADPADPESKIDALARAEFSLNSQVGALLRERGAECRDGPVSKGTLKALQSLYSAGPMDEALTGIGRADPSFNSEIRKRIAPIRESLFSVPTDPDKSKEPPALPLYLTDPEVKKVATGLVEFDGARHPPESGYQQ